MLWGLGVLPLLLWGLAATARRQRASETKLADARLFEHLAGRPDRRRRWPAALYGVAACGLIIAAARPVATVPLPTNRAALVLAIDTSRSMMAEDLKPSRLAAAKDAATRLAASLPRSIRIGLVAFSDIGTVLVAPTTDRRLLGEAMERLEPQQSTAVGSAVVEGLAILPGRREFLGDRLTRLRTQAAQDPLTAPLPLTPPPAAGELPPAAIVIFSDGVVNTGVDPKLPGALALEARVKVHGVGIGKPEGSIMSYGGGMVFVPFDQVSLQDLAQRTGGEYLNAVDDESIRRIAKTLGRSIGWERRPTEISALIAGIAGLLMTAGAMLSLAWFRRVP
jgi:Ca-activated chloride channel family protein